MSSLYPEIPPYKTHFLPVSDLHTIYVEESGNPAGVPVIFLHGGLAGSQPSYRQYFNPEKYRIILFDQRGCGQSAPFAELRENTTWDLVADMEKIREHLQISKWHVFGGSWGSTLALSYAIKNPAQCLSLVLRGIFLLRKKEIQWFYQSGASRLFPDAWEKYISPISKDERNDFISAYYKILTGDDTAKKIEAARCWSTWEAATSKLTVDSDLIESFDEESFAEAFARIECHYFINNGFFDTDNWILENVDQLKETPIHIVHGRYDVVCPIESAWDLKKALPHAQLTIAHQSGHSISEPEIANYLIQITDKIVS